MEAPKIIRKLLFLEADEKVIDFRGVSFPEAEVDIMGDILKHTIKLVVAVLLLPLLIFYFVPKYVNIKPEFIFGKVWSWIATTAIVSLITLFLLIDFLQTVKKNRRMIYTYTFITDRRLIEIEHTEDTRHLFYVSYYYEGILSIELRGSVESDDRVFVKIRVRDGSMHVRSWPIDLAKNFVTASRTYLHRMCINTRREGGVYL